MARGQATTALARLDEKVFELRPGFAGFMIRQVEQASRFTRNEVLHGTMDGSQYDLAICNPVGSSRWLCRGIGLELTDKTLT